MLNREKEFVARFWDPAYPLDLNYPLQQEIRDTFSVYDQPIQLDVDGERLQATCRIIESKGADENSLNFVHVLGSLSTVDNTISAPYPYLAEYLNKKKEDPTLPSARFILISQYNTSCNGVSWRPKTIAEWGKALSQMLEALAKKFDRLHCALGHSNGTISLGVALNLLSPGAIPSLSCFDRGPSSTQSVSKGYWGGAPLYFLANQSGWTVDLGQELHTFYEHKNASACIVFGALQDYYFPGEAGLTEHPLIAKLEAENKVNVFLFNPPDQLVHPRAHHALRADLLNGNYLIRASNQMDMAKKNLAQMIVAHSVATR